MNISVIEYEHRDCGNWKTFDYFYVKGELKLEQISKYMIGTEFFYPKVVGIPPLDPDNVFAGCPEFHDITDIRPFDPNRDALPKKGI